MSKSIMPEILELLGVEVDEMFWINTMGDNVYRFNSDLCLEFLPGGERRFNWQKTGAPTFVELIRGQIEIIKIPYTPALHDFYFSYTFTWLTDDTCDTAVVLVRKENVSDFYDRLVASLGFTYKTQEDAEAHKGDFVEFMKEKAKKYE